MRPSKLRLPDSTDTTARSPSSTAAEISSRQRPRVADARGAAVADEVEAERLEVLGQPGAVEVLGHDLRARGERGLHPRLDVQPALDRVAGEHPGAEHDRGVRGVRAARDRGDHHVAVVELELGAVIGLHVDVAGRALGHDGGHVDLRPRACAPPSPWPLKPLAGGSEAGKVSSIASSWASVTEPGSSSSTNSSQRLAEALLGVGQRHPVLRAARPARLGTTSPRSSSSVSE